MRDESLELRFQRRDAVAYDAAYRAFAPRMNAAALRLLRDPEAADECVHEVFLELWRRRTAYVCERGSLEAFLVACVRNRALMRLRDGKRRSAIEQRLHVVEKYEMQTDPIERARIAQALERLTDVQGDVVVRAYFRGMTLSEVAGELGVPIGTVKGRLAAALATLRRSLIAETNDGI